MKLTQLFSTREYDFYSFNSKSGNLTATVYLSPSLNALASDHPLRLGVQLDSQSAQTFQPIPDATPGNLPDAWNGPDGFVANAIVPVTSTWTNVSPGAHTFKIWMIEPTVVVQKIVIGMSFLNFLLHVENLIIGRIKIPEIFVPVISVLRRASGSDWRDSSLFLSGAAFPPQPFVQLYPILSTYDKFTYNNPNNVDIHFITFGPTRLFLVMRGCR